MPVHEPEPPTQAHLSVSITPAVAAFLHEVEAAAERHGVRLIVSRRPLVPSTDAMLREEQFEHRYG